MRAVAAALAVTAFVIAGGPGAVAEGPSDLLDPNTQGSLVDIRNAQHAAESDAGMSGFGWPVSAGADLSGCSAVMTKPQPEADAGSPTNVSINTRYSLQCLLDYGATNTFMIEYSTISGWRTLVSRNASASPHGGVAGAPMSAPCRAGTWHYRGRASGSFQLHHSDDHRDLHTHDRPHIHRTRMSRSRTF